MGFNLRGLLSSKADKKLKDYKDMKDTVKTQQSFNGDTVESKMVMSNRLFWEGSIALQPILTDAARQYSKNYGINYNNIKPQYLNELYKSSGIHSSIIDYKRDLLSSNYEFVYEPKDDLKLNKFKNVLIKKKNDFYDFDEFIRQFSQDYLIHGNVYFKIHKINGHINSIEHIRSERVRVNADIRTLKVNGYTISLDWTNLNGKSTRKTYEPYDSKKKDGTFIMCYKNSTPGDLIYGDNDYVAAIPWLELDCNIASFHTNNMINGIFPNGVMTFYDYPKDPTEFKKWKNSLRELSNPDNNSRLLIMTANNPDRKPDINDFPKSELNKEFLQLQEDVKREICYSHKIDPAVMGIHTAGRLGGGANEIEIQTVEFKENMLNYEKDVKKIINKLIQLSGYDFSFRYTEEDNKK